MSFETRRLQSHLIQFFKAVNKIDNFNWHSAILWSEPRVGKRAELRREIAKTSQRHNFFTNRFARTWISLPDEVVFSRSVCEFKSRVDPWLLANTQMAASWGIPASYTRLCGLLLLLLLLLRCLLRRCLAMPAHLAYCIQQCGHGVIFLFS